MTTSSVVPTVVAGIAVVVAGPVAVEVKEVVIAEVVVVVFIVVLAVVPAVVVFFVVDVVGGVNVVVGNCVVDSTSTAEAEKRCGIAVVILSARPTKELVIREARVELAGLSSTTCLMSTLFLSSSSSGMSSPMKLLRWIPDRPGSVLAADAAALAGLCCF